MRTYGEMTFGEIGRRMGISRQLAFVIYTRGMGKLARRLPHDPDFSIADVLDQMNGAVSLDPRKDLGGLPERTRPRRELASG